MPTETLFTRVKLGTHSDQSPRISKGMAVVTGMAEGLALEAYVARIMMSSSAHIRYVGESYGYVYEVDARGSEILKGACSAGSCAFTKV